MFFRNKYIFNKEKCQYESITFSFKKFFLEFFLFFALSGAFGLGILKYGIKYFGTPFEIQLASENSMLKEKFRDLQDNLEKIDRDLNVLREQDEEIYRVVLNADPLKKGKTLSKNIDYVDSEVEAASNRIDNLKHKIDDQRKSYNYLISLANKRVEYFASIPAIQPIENKKLKRIGDCFGMRKCHPVHMIPKMHYGVDYVAPIGTPVYSTGAGVVKTVRFSPGFGNLIEVNHGNGVVTRYAHLNSFNTKVGDKVIRGQCIGYVGMTGTVTGPHLHYEILRDHKQVDPISYFFAEISPSQYEAIIEVANKKMGGYKI